MLRSITLAATAVLLTHAAVRADEQPISYERQIRPILKAHCLGCHGELGIKRGSLDLRLRRFAVKGGDSGPAIQPGKPDNSLLLQRLRDGEMPPDEDKQLSPADVKLIADWIAAGAPTDHPEPEYSGEGPIFTHAERNYWAFRPVERPAVPEVADRGRVRTPIDAFLLAELQHQSLSAPDKPAAFRFAPDADRRRLIRRASFDLLGLPSDPEKVAEFEADSSPTAWTRLIDRLLDSPHYGERWGRHWLDVAGYADSEGYADEDRVRSDAFRYRDYVIRSFNADKPFDQFIREQLAGDEMVPRPHRNLSPEEIDKLTATGFLRMAPDGTSSRGVEQDVARNQVMADTLQIVSTSLLGLTLHCARCHDHRYDPIPQADYYSLRAIFEPALGWKNWKTPPARRISLYTDADRKLAAEIEAEADAVDQARKKKAEEYITRTLEEELLLVPEEVRDTLRTAYRTAAKQRTTEQKALLKEYPSVASIREGSLYLYDRRRSVRAAKIDAERKEKEKRFVAETAARELQKVPADRRAAVTAALKAATETRTTQQIALLEKYPGVSVTLASLSKFNPEAAAEIERDRKAAEELRASKASDHLEEFKERAAEIRARKPDEGFLRTLTEVPGTVPATFLFHRGDHDQPKQQLKPGGLSILGNPPSLPIDDPELPTTGRRLAWARHLTSGEHPLVARVIVNRIWMHHFGRGLVNSPGDFGMLGERPTHPKLLDWLASEFVSSGWSVKHMHRLIMSSTAYRQSSVAHPDAVAFDPDNRFYNRFPIQRLEAEAIRDAVLAVSGRLNRKLYGKPVPVMEDAVGQIVLGVENLDGERKPTGDISLHGEEFRRSVYVQVRRSRTLSVFEAFDAPNMSPNCERRSVSTVATQSLMLMNSSFTVDYSRHFARRLMDEAGDDVAAQVARGWNLAYSLEPTSEDVAAARKLIERQQQLIEQQNPKADRETVHRQALATFCQALLSSSRFLYVD